MAPNELWFGLIFLTSTNRLLPHLRSSWPTVLVSSKTSFWFLSFCDSNYGSRPQAWYTKSKFFVFVFFGTSKLFQGLLVCRLVITILLWCNRWYSITCLYAFSDRICLFALVTFCRVLLRAWLLLVIMCSCRFSVWFQYVHVHQISWKRKEITSWPSSLLSMFWIFTSPALTFAIWATPLAFLVNSCPSHYKKRIIWAWFATWAIRVSTKLFSGAIL